MRTQYGCARPTLEPSGETNKCCQREAPVPSKIPSAGPALCSPEAFSAPICAESPCFDGYYYGAGPSPPQRDALYERNVTSRIAPRPYSMHRWEVSHQAPTCPHAHQRYDEQRSGCPSLSPRCPKSGRRMSGHITDGVSENADYACQ